MRVAIIYDAKKISTTLQSANDRRVYNMAKAVNQFAEITYILHPKWRSNNENTVNYLFHSKEIGNLNLLFNILKRFSFYYQSYKEIVTNKIDIVILYNPIWDSIILMILLRLKKIKFGLEICDLHSGSKTTKNGLKNLIVRALIILPTEKILPRLTNFNIVISETLRKLIKSKCVNKPILKLPILVDTDYFSEKINGAKLFRSMNEISNDTIVLSFCGSYWYYEGADLLLKAFANIVKVSNKSIKLVFIGNIRKRAFKTDVLFLTKKLGLDGKVIATGVVDEDKLLEAFSATDIFVLPQIKDKFTEYAFPTIIGEYSSMGKAIVASNTGELPSYFTNEENILFFENNDISLLEEKILVLVNNFNLRTKLGISSRTLAEKEFGIAENSKKLFVFFDNLLKS